jgi:hypothetical protein
MSGRGREWLTKTGLALALTLLGLEAAARVARRSRGVGRMPWTMAELRLFARQPSTDRLR